MAASVSRRWHFAFSATSSGTGRASAAATYSLSSRVIGETVLGTPGSGAALTLAVGFLAPAKSAIGPSRSHGMPQIHARSRRMIGEASLLLHEISAAHLALLAAVAFVAATVSGMSGVGGGLLLAIFIAPIVGVKAVVPTVGVATLIAHVVRVWVYREHIVWRPALVMLARCAPGNDRERPAVCRAPG